MFFLYLNSLFKIAEKILKVTDKNKWCNVGVVLCGKGSKKTVSLTVKEAIEQRSLGDGNSKDNAGKKPVVKSMFVCGVKRISDLFSFS